MATQTIDIADKTTLDAVKTLITNLNGRIPASFVGGYKEYTEWNV